MQISLNQYKYNCCKTNMFNKKAINSDLYSKNNCTKNDFFYKYPVCNSLNLVNFSGNIPYKSIVNSVSSNNYELDKIIKCTVLKKSGIPNLQIIENKGVRGETLSSSKNFKYLQLIKDCGIDTVIDLRTADYTAKYKEKCDRFGLNYYHIPIDKDNMSDKEILQKLPLLFKLLERGKFYIACAQGKHRTDIALAINYVFNPKQKTPPFMFGHTSFHKTDMVDVNRRLNSLFKSMTEEDKFNLGWDKDFDDEFVKRKRTLKSFSEMYEEPYCIY